MNRREAATFEEALGVFDACLHRKGSGPYAVFAFSLGALYFQHWLTLGKNLPTGQVLLAPALYIHRFALARWVFSLLPSKLMLKSFSPAHIRRFEQLGVSDYRLLMEGLSLYHRKDPGFPVPTLMMIDPKDELVSAKDLEKKLGTKPNLRFKLFPRPRLKPGLGVHHILFHPAYHEEEDWLRLTQEISEFLEKTIEERSH